ncbi:Gfo/Idh/MocA family protein [Gimesia panareensis]|uniref:Dehydrogenase n=1 Tax=Gimesia panareensis TaxID=2527978 RepID=A0A518A0V4_9PLAN|nr:Gfo/Idh/MocA family oxidoreductase [Gimesia panareensis]QDT25403.1 Dehydrogenase [Gimesia panareensis]QDU48363.1 Dehydrogenase [Gimesia panareensis]
MSSLNVAVVGVGALGRHHARILAGLEGVNLCAVADTNPDQGQAIAEQHGTRWVANYRELFDSVDAVSLAVPTHAHLAIASEFLSQQIPVLVEKPIACNLAEAEELVRIADAHQTLLQIGHVERFNPATQAAFQRCPQPRFIRSERVSPYTFRSTDIGVIHDLLIHDIDLVLSLVQSPLSSVEAFGISVMGEHEDAVQARLRFQNGCIADLTASRICPVAKRTMQLWGVSGCVTVDFTSREVNSYRPSETLLYGTPPLERARKAGVNLEALKQEVFGTFLKVENPEVSSADALTAELSSFVEAIRSNTAPLVGGAQALEAMQVAERVLEAVNAHQWDGSEQGAVGPFIQFPSEQRRLAG